MKLLFESGSLYINNQKLCKYEVANHEQLTPGVYSVEARYAHAFGCVLPYITDIGWLGSDAGCAIYLGQVLGKSGLLPDSHFVRVLVGRLEEAAETDASLLALVA